MAILFVTHKFPPSIGGMQKQSYELINGMCRLNKVYTIAQSLAEGKVWYFIRLLFRIRRMLRHHSDIQVIHCNDGVTASVCAIFLKTKIPITATLHGLDIVFPNPIFQKWIIPKLYRLQRVFAVSQATAQACIKRGFDAEKIIIIKNGADLELKDIPIDPGFSSSFFEKHGIDISHKKILLSTGRAVKRKGFSWFVTEVLPNLPDDVHYLIVGPTISRESLLQKLLHLIPLQLRSNIELFFGLASDSQSLNEAIEQENKATHLGKLPWQELVQLMSYADLMLLPNINIRGDMEGFGLVALEAGLRGTYVVASATDGITCAVIDEKNGTLLPAQDHRAWIATLTAMLSPQCNLLEKGKHAQQYIPTSYSWKKMVTEYHTAFSKLQYETEQLKESKNVTLSRVGIQSLSV